MSNPEAVRRYWRKQKRRQRDKLSTRRFKPRILRFEKCSLCYQWHPVRVIVPSGRIMTVALDVYHDQPEIYNMRHNFGVLVKLNQGDPQNALNRCIQWQMMEEGVEDEEAARGNCELLFEDPQARQRWEDKIEKDNMLQTQQEICVLSRMDLYHEGRETAEANCQLILSDPLYRHMPPGLVPPMETKDVDRGQSLKGMSVEDQSQISDIMQCFYHQVEVEKMDPEEAMQKCVKLLMVKKGEKKTAKATVGDLYGKSRKEIDAMSEKPQDARLTVGNTFGKSRKQLLEEQRLARQQEKENLVNEGAYMKSSEFTPPSTIDVKEMMRREEIRKRHSIYANKDLEDRVERFHERQIAHAKRESEKKLKKTFEKKLGEGK